ncbi:SpoIIE family protein phosphatase [Streptomyces sp. NPDC058691]|uniref:SpoIIE family protein phosphatase n=1 Tax=Streptomyces sp. NPDC058691 TaxID=3346601 RepID=UPI00364F3ECB
MTDTMKGRDRRYHDVRTAALDTLLRDSLGGVYIFDSDLRLLRSNTGTHPGALGTTAGRRIGEIMPGFDAAVLERMLREVVSTGTPVIDREERGRDVSNPRRDRVVSISALPVRDEASACIGVIATVHDVTSRARAQARCELLHQADLRIGTTLDVSRTAHEFASIALPRSADVVTVDVLDCVLRGEAPPPGPVQDDVLLRRVAALAVPADADAGASPSPGPLRTSTEARSFPFPSPYTQSLSDHRPRLIRHLREDAVWVTVPATGDSEILADGAHSLMVLPLSHHGAVLGFACFYRTSDPDPFDEDDLRFASALADRTAVAMDNARLYTRERTAAQILQRRLLPAHLPVVTAVETSHCYAPGRSDTAWFDVIALSGTQVALVAGDVLGHGVQAAATMGRLRMAVQALSALDLPPDEVLARLDDLVSRLAVDEPGASEECADAQPVAATCAYVVYDPVSRRCTMARAGHAAPVIVDADGTARTWDAAAGPPLGRGNLPFDAAEAVLAEGSVLALYTDGLLTSLPEGAEAAMHRLRQILADPERPLQDICDAALYALLPGRPKEDVVLLLARTRTLSGQDVATLHLPSDPAAVAAARAGATAQLEAWGLSDLVPTTELVVSELVTNAVRYGANPIQLRLVRDHCLICEVTDGGGAAPRLRHARTSDEGGRGLLIVSRLTQRWGIRYSPEGKSVWAEQVLRPLPE